MKPTPPVISNAFSVESGACTIVALHCETGSALLMCACKACRLFDGQQVP